VKRQHAVHERASCTLAAVGPDDLDLNLLRVLDAVLTEMSVTRAAERLHITQSAVSHALARLRTALDDPLLVREGAVMRPTAEALRLAGEVQDVMRRIRTHIAPSRFDPASTRRSFVLGVPDAITVRVALPLLRVMTVAAPLSSLHLRRLAADSISELASGTMDAAISVPGYFPASAQSSPVLEVRWQGIVRTSHPLAGRNFTMADTVEWPHVVAASSPVNERIDHALQALGLRRTSTISLNTAALLAAVVAEADLVGFIPEHEKVSDRISVSDLGAEAPVLDYNLYWNASSAGDSGHQWFLRTVLDSFAGTTRHESPS
jgi:DNA-binding transcriptional LysR family regulator